MHKKVFEPLGPPSKLPPKNKNVVLSNPKIGPSGALKLPLKYFLLVFGKKRKTAGGDALSTPLSLEGL